MAHTTSYNRQVPPDDYTFYPIFPLHLMNGSLVHTNVIHFFLFTLSTRARFCVCKQMNYLKRQNIYTGERVIRENTLVVVLASSRQIRPRIRIYTYMYMHTSLYIILKNLHSIRRQQLKCLCR